MKGKIILGFFILILGLILHAEQIAFSDDILSSNGQADRFGWSCDLSGDYAVVGAYGHDDPETNCGAAYVFFNNAGNWQQVAKLQRVTPQSYDIFGYSVSIDGDVVVVGAPQVAGGSYEEGKAYVFVKPVTGWEDMTPTAVLSGSGVDGSDEFGNCVDIDGDYIFVGTFGESDIYIYEKPIGGWVSMFETWSITHSAPWFGHNLEVSGDYAAIGAYGDNNYAGACYVYEKTGADWIQTAKLTASDATQGNPNPENGDWLGIYVSMQGNTVAASSSKDDNNKGAVYLWEMPVTGWEDMTETAKLTASDASGGTTSGDRLGSNLSLFGDYVCAGAYLQHNTNGEDAGAAYIYIKPSGGWVDKTEDQKLLASNGIENALFGFDVALEGDNLLIGSYGFDTDPPNEPLTGVVYFYDGMLDLKIEPSNHVNDFTANPFSANQIDLVWTENDGTQAPDGYLILASTGTITAPVDGSDHAEDTDLTDGEGSIQIAHGSTSYSFTNCSASTTYNFQIYPYTNSDDFIDYKTDGTVPSDDATTYPAEPTNHVLDFSASALDHTQINVSWTENDGTILPTGYLIKSSTGVIADPIDGESPVEDTDLTDGNGIAYVNHGNEIYSFFSVNATTTYHFKIYPYSGSGTSINYKTGGTVPSDDATTPAVPVDPVAGDLVITEICGDGADGVDDLDGFLEIYNTSLNNISLDNVTIRYYDNGSDSPIQEMLFGSLNSHEYFVIGQSNFTVTYGFSPDWDTMMFPLNGGLDSIEIYLNTKRASVIDRFNDHSDPWSWDDSIPLQRTSTGDGATESYWTESSEGATPGEEGDYPLAVSLSSFTIIFIDEKPVLEWITHSEDNNAGWNLYRGKTKEALELAETKLINFELIPGAGSCTEPVYYEYKDQFPVQAESTYFYWLESVSYNGFNEYYGPISIKVPDDIQPDQPEIPLQYSVENYPNPFNPETCFEFVNPKEGFVVIHIYNLLGQKIKSLIEQELPEGNHQFIWNGCDDNNNKLGSGVYLYRLQIDGQIKATNKCLMLK